jgi:alpha-beta hydrolase superfamily lysophospholipase
MSATGVIPRWPWLLVLVSVAGLTGVPAHAQDANPIATGAAPVGRLPKGFTEKSAKVNGVRINYQVGGNGPVVVLLHGYTQTSHMWIPLMPLLATSHTVIAPDLRGVGGSERTPGGYDKKTMAKDIRELVHQLGDDQPAAVAGHDIGLMVAYAYAAQYPGEVARSF